MEEDEVAVTDCVLSEDLRFALPCRPCNSLCRSLGSRRWGSQ